MIATATLPSKPLERQAGHVPAKLSDFINLRPTDDFDAVRIMPSTRLTPDQLTEFCQENDALRIEQSAEGELIILLPLHTDNGLRETKLVLAFASWAENDRNGQVFGANAGWTLSNGAMRSPGVSWVKQGKLDTLTPEQWKSFAPLCPDFVVELRSRTEDRLPTLQEKMAEYIANGAQLGWLIDPLERQVFVYRPGQPVEHLQDPATLPGEPVLTGFTLDLARVW